MGLGRDYCHGNAIKYLWRLGHKGDPLTDARRAGWYVSRLIDCLKRERSQWWIGDWLNYGEGRPEWGDKYEQAISMFGKEYQTLVQYKNVARAIEFNERSLNLPWSHHMAVASQPPAVRRELLEAADRTKKPPGVAQRLGISLRKPTPVFADARLCPARRRPAARGLSVLEWL